MTIQDTDIRNGWKETTLGEVCEIKYGKDHKNQKNGNIPCFGSGGLMRYVEDFIYNKPSVLIPRKGTISNLFFVETPFWTVDTLFYTKINETKILAKFLFYKLKNEQLENLNVGSAVPSLTTEVLNKFQLSLPSLLEQETIVRMLSSFDNKIELLREQNETLEKTAQIIFQEWFGKYSIDDELPEGWRVGRVSDCMNIIGGGTPKTTIDDYWNGDIPWFSVVDCPIDSVFVIETEKNISKKGLDNSSTKILPIYTTIITSRGTVGKLTFTGLEMTMNQSCYGLQSITGNNFYLFLMIQQAVKILKSRVHGAVFDTITKDTFSGIDMVIPDTQSLLKFEEIVKPIFQKLLINTFQIQYLSKTRDMLLPKLMKEGINCFL